MSIKDDERWMAAAIAQARVAEREGDVPVGALIVKLGKCIAQVENRRREPQTAAGDEAFAPDGVEILHRLVGFP